MDNFMKHEILPIYTCDSSYNKYDCEISYRNTNTTQIKREMHKN